MPRFDIDVLKNLEARCRLVASDLEDEGFGKEHDTLVTLANSLGGIRTAQFGMMPMVDEMPGGMGMPYELQELADVGSPENPRPTEEEVLDQRPAPGSRLDPARGPEDVLRKWVVEIRDIPASDEDELRSKVEPFVEEIGGLLADYKEEAPRTRQRSGGGR